MKKTRKHPDPEIYNIEKEGKECHAKSSKPRTLSYGPCVSTLTKAEVDTP